MRRARMDGANDAFFKLVAPATIRDFYPAIAMIGAVTGAGIYMRTSGDTGVIALLSLIMTTGLAIYQFRITASFWGRSLSDDWPGNTG